MASNFKNPYIITLLQWMDKPVILKRLAGGSVVGGVHYTIKQFEIIHNPAGYSARRIRMSLQETLFNMGNFLNERELIVAVLQGKAQ